MKNVKVKNFYIAGDDTSSGWIGYQPGSPPNFQILINLKPQTLIFVPHGLDEQPVLPGPFAPEKFMPLIEARAAVTVAKLDAIENEIIAKQPSLEVCRRKHSNYQDGWKPFSRYPILPILVNIAAEQANAGVVLYKTALERRTDFTWLQLINANSIESFRLGTYSQEQQNQAFKFGTTLGNPPQESLWRIELIDYKKN